MTASMENGACSALSLTTVPMKNGAFSAISLTTASMTTYESALQGSGRSLMTTSMENCACSAISLTTMSMKACAFSAISLTTASISTGAIKAARDYPEAAVRRTQAIFAKAAHWGGTARPGAI